MKKFIKLSRKEVDQELLDDAVSQLNRAIQRRKMDLEDKISEAKTNAKKVSLVTDLGELDPSAWVESREEALHKIALAEKELEIFTKNFINTEDINDFMVR